MKPILFTEAELETIEAAMEDYQHYADPDTPASDLIGGLPVMDRYNSICLLYTSDAADDS